MATTLRATVMLVVLVGLPATWVYYGPLPPSALGVIQRTVETAKQSLPAKKSPTLFDAALAQAAQLQPSQSAAPTPRDRPPGISRDPQFTLASATVPERQARPSVQIATELASQLEPQLKLLRSLNAAEYTLENWGGKGELFRFRCAVALGANDDHTRQFEAVDTDPLRAVRQVIGEVTSWQNARHFGGATRWQ